MLKTILMRRRELHEPISQPGCMTASCITACRWEPLKHRRMSLIICDQEKGIVSM